MTTVGAYDVTIYHDVTITDRTGRVVRMPRGTPRTVYRAQRAGAPTALIVPWHGDEMPSEAEIDRHAVECIARASGMDDPA